MCKHLILSAVGTVMLLWAAVPGFAITTPVLGTAEDYAVLGHTTVTNTGPTVVFGSASTLANVGNWQAGTTNAIVGFDTNLNTFYGAGPFTNGPGLVYAPAAIHGGDGPGPGTALNARNDLIAAYVALAGYPSTGSLTGVDLGTRNISQSGALAPGVYSFSSTAQLTGTLQLDAGGVDGVYWVFQIGSSLTTASASVVELINPGGNLGADVGVFWVVGTGGSGSATLGTTTAFEGNILALDSITLNTGATIYNGRALARNGAVTLDTNVISDICPTESEDVSGGHGSSSPNSGPGFSGGLGFDTITGQLVPTGPSGPGPGAIPEPLTLGGLALGVGGLCGYLRRRKCAAGGS